MNSIHLQQTLPQVFADRNSVTSDVWHQDLFFRKGEMYLIEAASGTGKSSLCSYIYGYRNDYQGIINFDETNIKAYSVKQWVDLRKHSLSMLFQDLRIFTELSALENVQLKNNLTGCKKKKEILSFFEQLGIADKIRQIVLWNCAKHYLNVCKTKISIKNNYPLACFSETYSKIYRKIRLSDSAFSAGNCHYACIILIILIVQFYYISQLFCLIHHELPPNNCFTIFCVSNNSISSGTFCPFVV